jgi:hypothetical protein
MKRVEGANSNIAIEGRVLAGGLPSPECPSSRKINNERRIRMDAQSEKITGRNCDAFLGESRSDDGVLRSRHKKSNNNKVTTVSRRGTVGRSRAERHAREDDVR